MDGDFNINESAHWDRLVNADLPIALPEPRWSAGEWSLGHENAAALYELVRITKPRIIIETGTFEGHGTTTLAAAAHKNANNTTIFTVDYNGDLSDPIPNIHGISRAAWAELEAIRSANLTAAREKYPNCEIRLLEGDTRKVLPQLTERIDSWDLFFQDSMHFVEGIRVEWEALKRQSSSRAIAIFDDVSEAHPFAEYFEASESVEWGFRTDWGYWGAAPRWKRPFSRRASAHPQLWAQRRT